MSTAKHRRSVTVAGPQAGTGARVMPAAGKASERIPVLIRLPRLRLEPEPSEDLAAERDESELRMTIPLPRTVADPLRLPDAADDPRHTIDNTFGALAPMPSESSSFISRNSPWKRFHPPRWAVHGGIALVLFAVLGIAFSAIRQPQQANEDAPSQSPFAVTMPPPERPGDERPIRPAGVPVASADAVPQGPVTAAAAARTESSLPAGAAPASVADSGSDHAKTADTESQRADVPAETTAASQAPSATVVPMGAQRQTAETLDLDANTPLTGEASRDAASVYAGQPTAGQPTAGQPRYPATDPGTFQYPADYHERLRSRAGGPEARINEASSEGPLLNAPRTSEASVYGWQPNTARLQPRIEPPPVR